MLATLAEALPRGGEWLYEVKFDGYRALAYVRGRHLRAALPRRQRPHDALRGGRDGDREGGRAARRRPRRRGLRARRPRAGRASRRCSRARDRSSTTPSTCSRLDGEPLVDLPLERAARAAARPARAHGRGRSGSRTASRTARRCSRRSRAQGLEGVVAKRRGSKYAQGRRTRDWLKIKTHGAPGVRDRRLHARLGDALGHVRLARPRPSTRAASSATPATSGRGSTTSEIERLLELLRAARAARPAVSRGAEDAARPSRRRHLGRAEARRRGRVQRVDARRPRPPALLQGAARRQAGRRGAARAACRRRSIRRRQAASSSSRNLDKPFWPDEGITKGDLLEYYRQVAPVLVPHLAGRPFTMRRYPDGALREGVLPEGRALAHAGVDPDASGRRSRRARGRRRRSSSRSSTTSSRCSGW